MKDLVKGSGGARKMYDHLMSTDVFGVASKVKEAKKNNYQRKPKRGRK